jgi:CSLREA domain-containing protein
VRLEVSVRNRQIGVLILVVATVGAAPATADAATIEVTTTTDSAANDDECSLREAITATNTDADVNGADDCNHDGNSGPDVIELPAGTLPTLGAAGEDANASGDLDVEAGERLTIRGKGAGDTHVDGDLDRVIHLESGRLTLRSLEVTDGEAGAGDGGGVLAQGSGKLELNRATVAQSSGTSGGGVAVRQDMDLSLSRATISGNIADSGGIFDDGGGLSFDGASAKIDRSSLSGNSALTGDGGGLAVTGQDGAFKIARSSFINNHADDRAGGGISYDLFQGKMTVSRSLISQNTARFAGGGIRVANDANILVLKRSAVATNSLSSTANEVIGGGGIANGGVARMKDSIVAGNTLASANSMASLDGAGVRNDNGLEMTIEGSLITENTSPYDFGGGIYSTQPLEVTNSTISANGVGTGGGGGLFAAFDPVVLSHVTFAGNEAAGDGDAIGINSADVTLHAAIVANGADACDEPVISTGFNLDESASCGFAAQGDLPSTPAKLKPLDDNGGPAIGPPGLAASTLTHALKKRSKAVNLVPKSECDDAAGKRIKTDQRGVRRPAGGDCDGGAYERRPAPN